MIKHKEFYTQTMAKVYAAQGYLDEAAKIYEHLLEREPGRQDLVDVFSEVKMQIAEKHATGKKDLTSLLREWMTLLLEYDRIQKLKKLRRQFK